MKLLYAGCNIFGQIIDCDNITIGNFTEVDLRSRLKVENSDESQVYSNLLLSHSFNILQASRNKIELYGHGFEPNTTHIVTELALPRNSGNKIVDISCSDTRILVINDIGEIFILNLLERPIALQHRKGLFLNELHQDDKIVRIANGMTISVAVSEKGQIFSIPNLISYMGSGVVDICCGNEHCLILDKVGNVYTFGNNSRGQLGIGNLNPASEPVLVDILAGLNIVQIAAGGWHSCALSAAGDVYLWGWNNEGQLADVGCFTEDVNNASSCSRSTESNGASVWVTPTLLKLPDTDVSSGLDERVVGVACGARHTVVINDKGVVYGMGCNKFNQLGIRNVDNVRKVTSLHRIQNFQTENVKIICGPAATAIII